MISFEIPGDKYCLCRHKYLQVINIVLKRISASRILIIFPIEMRQINFDKMPEKFPSIKR